jgi:hypothetical protein
MSSVDKLDLLIDGGELQDLEVTPSDTEQNFSGPFRNVQVAPVTPTSLAVYGSGYYKTLDVLTWSNRTETVYSQFNFYGKPQNPIPVDAYFSTINIGPWCVITSSYRWYCSNSTYALCIAVHKPTKLLYLVGFNPTTQDIQKVEDLNFLWYPGSFSNGHSITFGKVLITELQNNGYFYQYESGNNDIRISTSLSKGRYLDTTSSPTAFVVGPPGIDLSEMQEYHFFVMNQSTSTGLKIVPVSNPVPSQQNTVDLHV